MATSAPLPDLLGGTDDGAACIWDAEDEAATLDVVDNHRLSSAEIRKKCLFQSKAPPCPRTRKGMLHSVPNINRHKPIKYEMFGLEGIKSISSMVRDFRSALYPWGGWYRFKSNSKWIDGPVDSMKREYATIPKWGTWPAEDDANNPKWCTWVEPDVNVIGLQNRFVLHEDIPQIYQDYVCSYVQDLKEIYFLNKWPCAGVDYSDPDDSWADGDAKVLTVEDHCHAYRKLFRPWGGTLALKWPKPGEKVQLRVGYCDPKKKRDKTVFVGNDCPWYLDVLREDEYQSQFNEFLDSDLY